ncbi:hypothetical protein PR048_013429 [Dryococelus australis]|uniref:Transposase n=1 Tax=Dryococelus australis TaxID=614101 RepID=A0ABQ9HSZ3_9NEOP|nr:hypothetical protein PR048_013429 [Dryococelus australis]
MMRRAMGLCSRKREELWVFEAENEKRYGSLQQKTNTVIIVDVSENYACKLPKETQTYQFGVSRNQATIHTGRKGPWANSISFASISESLNHCPAAIWAHLKPVLSFLNEHFSQIKKKHFFSDSVP